MGKEDIKDLTRRIGKSAMGEGYSNLPTPRDDRFYEEGHMIDDVGYSSQGEELTLSRMEQIISEAKQKITSE